MRIVAALLLLSLPFLASSQTPLAFSRHSSVYTYIYRITPEEARQFHSRKLDPEKKLLHTLVDSFSRTPPLLQAGNYLLLRAVENRLQFELLQEGDVHFTVLPNDRHLAILLHRANGAPLQAERVELGGKPLRYDPASGTYRLAKKRADGTLRIRSGGVLYQYGLQRNRYRNVSFFGWVKTHFPVKQIRYFILSRRFNGYPDFAHSTPYERKFRGYLAFSKPEYRPGDTVRGKAFVTTKKGRPVHRPLLLRLSDRYLDIDTILATIRPYNKGGYSFSFVLNDSLDLDLDEHFTLTLEELRSRKYDLRTYEGKLDEDEYAAKRNVLMRGRFRHEDYELKNTLFTASADRKEHGRGTPLTLSLKATDENELSIADGRVRVRVLRETWNDPFFHAAKVFIADTLWQEERVLGNKGELKLIIPDSLFPAASFSYRVECELLTSDNEKRSAQMTIRYKGQGTPMDFNWKGDSLYLDTERGWQRPQQPVNVLAINRRGDTVERYALRLPAAWPFNPFVQKYIALSDSSREEYRPEDAGISGRSNRTADSVWIELVNPHGLQVWYTIYAGNRVVQQGRGSELRYAAKTRTDKPYFLSLQYLAGGNSQKRFFNVPFFSKQLELSVDQPRFVYPGQTAEITIQVRDKKGRPQSNTDLTAFAYTRNFTQAQTVALPYFGRRFKGLRTNPGFVQASLDLSRANLLNWERWSREMALDTIEYFRFLHPEKIHLKREPSKDSFTVVAPFVVENGAIVPIQMLYIDGVPRFFSQTNDLKRYSFQVSPGYRNFEIRTANKSIIVNKVWVEKGVKTFFSVDGSRPSDSVLVQKQPPVLTAAEQNLWRRYLILVENNFEEGLTYVRKNGQLTLLRPTQSVYRYPGQNLLAGPYPEGPAELVSTNGFRQSFETEGNNRYRIEEGYVRQKETPKDHWFNTFLYGQGHTPSFSDQVLTEKEIDSLWQDYLDHRSLNEDLFTNPDLRGKHTGSLQFEWKNDSMAGELKNVFLLKADDPDFLRVYRGGARNLGAQAPGRYRIYFLFTKERYAVQDSIIVRANGINFYRIALHARPGKDSFSKRISELIDKRLKRDRYDNSVLEQLKPGLNTIFYHDSEYNTEISGVIRDQRGEPISFASVRIKGTNRAVMTDARGAYRILAPANAQLQITAVGYETRELPVSNAGGGSLALFAAKEGLSEVVVTGYGVTRKRSMTASVARVDQALEGRVAGLTISGEPGAAGSILIRGASSISGNAKPLFIVDGLPVPAGALDTLDPALIADLQVIDAAKATGIYGSDAVHGVVLITTTRAMQNSTGAADGEIPAGSIRRNFRDDAYWQPLLRTDREGKARFTVTFPDDLTNWRSFVLAMGPKRTSGQWEGSIRAFRPLVASLNVPMFLTEEDTLSVIGKAVNHIGDSLQLRRIFTVNGAGRLDGPIALSAAWIDTLGLRASGDSMRLRYAIRKESGYADGEERVVPVYRKGVLETSGFFLSLSRDTTINMVLPQSGKVHLHAEASALPVLEEELERVRNYSYNCNEQMASKLKALLLRKKLDAYYKRGFTGERELLALVGQLQRNRNTDGLWGWWPNAPSQLWITRHVAEALLQAKEQGYTISLDLRALRNELIYELERNRGEDKITALRLLQKIDTTADVKRYADTIAARDRKMSLYNRLRLLEIRQANGEQVSLDTVRRYRRETLFGNLYWGEDSLRFFDNAIQNTLLAYRVLRASKAGEDELARVRNYLLEKRSVEGWRNTYESALILETILPDLLGRDSLVRPARLELIGTNTLSVTKFPFDLDVNSGAYSSLRKTGDLPVYFTAYEQHWNRAPQRVDADFRVRTRFEQNGEDVNRLTGGRLVLLKVRVDVARDAEYVMINVPIPAGCSYEDKSPGRANNEVHREHFRDRTTIFCGRLNKGSYEFTIRLMPRYSGRYTLNPARAEQMYFPVFFGREESKTVEVR